MHVSSQGISALGKKKKGVGEHSGQTLSTTLLTCAYNVNYDDLSSAVCCSAKGEELM